MDLEIKKPLWQKVLADIKRKHQTQGKKKNNGGGKTPGRGEPARGLGEGGAKPPGKGLHNPGGAGPVARLRGFVILIV